MKIFVKNIFFVLIFFPFFSLFASDSAQQTLYFAALAMEEGDFEKANCLFEKVYNQTDCSNEALLARYLAFQLGERLGDHARVAEHRKALLNQFKESPLTEEALIVQELFGEPLNIHIEQMERLFPRSPYLSYLWYRKGLALILQKRYSEAIHFLERAETRALDDEWFTRINDAKIEAYLALCATSGGPKRSVYHKLAKEAIDRATGEKAPFFQAALSFDRGDTASSARLCNEMIAFYREQNVSKNQILAKAHHLLAKIYILNNEQKNAKDELDLAIDAYLDDGGDLLLTLHMEKSRLLEQMGDIEGAIKSLSSAINAPIISPMRVEAMEKRALLFDKMGRQDLAYKQQLALQQIKRGVH